MFAASKNVAILAAAGSRKTQIVIDTALSYEGRVLITTYTRENCRQIVERIQEACGTVPPNIDVLGWYPFLITHGAKPYQAALLKEAFVLRGLNFDGEPVRGTAKTDPRRYFIDTHGNLYRKHLADFVVRCDSATNGAVVKRLEHAYAAILIDEVQDMVGWDLELLDLLIASELRVLMVGDPRQHTYGTSTSSKNKPYRGLGLQAWFNERDAVCERRDVTESYRCHQSICDFADGIYPSLPTTTSVDVPDTGHDGIFTISESEVHGYMSLHSPQVLRPRRDRDTLGLEAMNIGVAKGRTFDRVLIFPTAPMRQYLVDGNPSALKAPQSLYVAVTRARFSATFVV